MHIHYCLTTTNLDWRNWISDAKKYGITELCFFPTGLSPEERKQAYTLLKENGVSQIPFVHLRHDSDSEEIEFCMREFDTHVFSVHSNNQFPRMYDVSRYKECIYLETALMFLEPEIHDWAGLCFDAAHVENQRLKKIELYEDFMRVANQVPIGVTHVSAIVQKPWIRKGDNSQNYDVHTYQDLSDFDYLKNCTRYMQGIMTLELEESFERQREAKSYIEKLLS